jgi:hypothetical protein
MAKIILSATMIRYPLGGMNQWILAWLVGLKRLRHEVYLIEHFGWQDACYDVSKGIMTGDCSYGVRVVKTLLERYDLENNWCFIDENQVHHGMSKTALAKLFESADVFIDLEWGEWQKESAKIPVRIFFDGDPGWFQFSLMDSIDKGEPLPTYDYYFTTGGLVGKPHCGIPLAGIHWRHMISPVLLEGPGRIGADPGRAFTTVMNWQSNKEVEYRGEKYGQKDVEFMKFIDLPRMVGQPLEVAVSGSRVPGELLLDHGWKLCNADKVAVSLDSYRQYIAASRGEFSVAKNAFVKTRSGWFGERSGYYLYGGRPAIVQDTGFSEYLPCGEGLIAFASPEEAALGIRSVCEDYELHSRAAREIAREYLDACHALDKMLKASGVN